MSPLSPERLRVVLAPGGVRLARERGWLRRRRIDNAVLPCGPDDGPPWRAPLATLQAALAEPRWRGAPLWLTLSDRLLRYQLLPWLPELDNPADRQGYARFHFRQVYGALADDWEIRVDEAPPGLPAVACAADQALPAALTALAATAGIRLAGIRPAFAAVFNRLRPRLPAAGEPAVLALAEPGALCYGLFAAGRWLALRQRAVAAEPTDTLADTLAEALAEALAQERLMLDLPFDRATVHLVAYPDPADAGRAELGAAWTVRRLSLAGDFPEWSGAV